MCQTITPWGKMWKIVSFKYLWMKVLHVTGRTSLQSHSLRTEIIFGFKSFLFIPKDKKHRLSRGWYVEISYGLPKETDITRFEDDYGRCG